MRARTMGWSRISVAEGRLLGSSCSSILITVDRSDEKFLGSGGYCPRSTLSQSAFSLCAWKGCFRAASS